MNKNPFSESFLAKMRAVASAHLKPQTPIDCTKRCSFLTTIMANGWKTTECLTCGVKGDWSCHD